MSRLVASGVSDATGERRRSLSRCGEGEIDQMRITKSGGDPHGCINEMEGVVDIIVTLSYFPKESS